LKLEITTVLSIHLSHVLWWLTVLGVLRLQAKGADVNGKVFRGYPATAAAREGRAEVAELLVRAGASQPACEEAVVEAALQGQAALAAIFMGSDLVRPRVAVHALVSAAARGFVDVVDTLVKVQCPFQLACVACCFLRTGLAGTAAGGLREERISVRSYFGPEVRVCVYHGPETRSHGPLPPCQ
jgi:hypothetical protein